jgi:AbrB family looped-hinge helix DNA binding protein
MTVTLKPKTEIMVPKSVRRKAGFKPGDRIEFQVSEGTITIIPKRSPDELRLEREDEREVENPKIRATIQRGYEEFLAGKTRPIKEALAERDVRSAKRTRQKPGA